MISHEVTPQKTRTSLFKHYCGGGNYVGLGRDGGMELMSEQFPGNSTNIVAICHKNNKVRTQKQDVGRLE